MRISSHSVDSISSFDLKTFCESLSPIGLNRLQTALLSEQYKREQRERFNKAKEEVIKRLNDFQNIIDAEEGKSSSCPPGLVFDFDCFVTFASLKETIEQLTLEDFKD